MLERLKKFARALIDRVDETTLEPIVNEFHMEWAKLEARLAACEAALGVKKGAVVSEVKAEIGNGTAKAIESGAGAGPA